MYASRATLLDAHCPQAWPRRASAFSGDRGSRRLRRAPGGVRAAPGGGPKQQGPPAAPPRGGPSSNGGSPAQPNSSGRGDGGRGAPGPPPPELPPQQRRLLALLVEFGGVYGTAACVLGYLLKLDPFGAFHWDAADVLVGLQLYAPLLALDAAVMAPDYSARDEQAEQVARLFFGADARLADAGMGQEPGAGNSGGGGGGAGASGSSGQGVDGSDQKAGAADVPLLLRAQVALELLQSFSVRSNPCIELPVWQDLAVSSVAALADEMLYRAVALTFLAAWLRDRFFEAGFDDDVLLAGAAALPTSVFAQYAAMGLVAALGVAGFVAKAYQDTRMVERVQIMTRDGKADAAKTEEVRRRLAAAVGRQSTLVYAVEGAREIALGVASGLAFVWTGNLAAAYAGGLSMQVLHTLLQRFALGRQRTRRRAAAARAAARAGKIQAAIAAAKRAQAAEQAGTVTGDTPGGTRPVDGRDSGGSDAGGGGSSVSGTGMDEVLSPAARVMLSDLEYKRAGGAATGLREAERQADLAQIRDALRDAPARREEAEAGGSKGGGSGGEDGAAGGSDSSPAAAQARAAADLRLASLLSDMMRSPEGRGVVRRFRGGAGANGSGGAMSDAEVGAYVDELLSDPDTRARLLRELESRLVDMAGRDGEGGGGGGDASGRQGGGSGGGGDGSGGPW